MITVIHPSRSRPKIAFDTYKLWVARAEKDFEYYISIDTDQVEEYEIYFTPEQLIVHDNKTAIEAVNNAAKKITHFDILVVISDDFTPPINWDTKIEQAVEGKSNFVLKTNDGEQGWIVTLPIMDKNYYDTYGYVYSKEFSHLFVDTQLTHIADVTKKLIIRNDIEFKQKFINDKQHSKTNSTWEQGKAVYLKNVINNFGLQNVDIFDLSLPYAKGHIEWLKKELKGYGGI